jgi:hypothetical protein
MMGGGRLHCLIAVLIWLAPPATAPAGSCADCPPDGIPENEPNCGLNDDGAPDDFVNGGCNGVAPLFTPIELGRTVCGTTAVDTVTGARDTDWYELVLTQETDVIWIVTAEHRVLSGIVDNGGVPDCAAASCFVAYGQWGLCRPGPVSAVLPPGTWWFYVAPFFQDESDCDFSYLATAVIRLPADLNADGDINVIDFWWLRDTWGSCPDTGPCTADLDGDGVVGAADFLHLLALWPD